MAGVDLDTVVQLQQPLKAVVEAACPIRRLRGEVRACRVADEEGIARQRQPRLVAASAVDDLERAVLRSMAGRVQHANGDRAELDLLAVLERVEPIHGLRRGVDRDRQSVIERKASVA